MPTTLRPRSTATTATEQALALSAPVSDPVWFLARQWQTRGLVATDGGDPVQVEIAVTTVPVELDGGFTQPDIEAEPQAVVPLLDTASRVRLANELTRFLRDSGMGAGRVLTVRIALAKAFPLQPVTSSAAVDPYTGRVPDAAELAGRLSTALAEDGTGVFPVLPGIDVAADPQLETGLRSWYAWTRRAACALDDSGDSAPPRWDATRLGYSAAATARLAAGAVQLTLHDYDGTGLDWHSMDRTALATAVSEPSPSPSPSRLVRPAPVTFAGMPNPRFWAFERGDVNLDAIAATDPAHALLATFAHAYSNDWFLVPVDVPPGATMIDRLQVTDSFGTSTAVQSAAAQDGPDSPWRMWELTPATPLPHDAALGLRVFFPPCAPPLEGPVLEDVLVARDEMANLGWVVELTVRDDDGTEVDRNRRWVRLRPATDPTYEPGEVAAYRLGTALPDHWYPLLAEPAPGGVTELVFAELPPGAVNVSDEGVAGHLVPHGNGTRLADEEATGTRISRVSRLTRSAGARRAWRARARRPGAGEAASGLRFDILSTPASATNLVRNGDVTLARRRPPGQLTGAGVPGDSAAENWTLWNNPATTTTTRVEPTTRPGGTGWMLRITTGAGGCGLVQQWGANDTGPSAAQAEAWVYVVHGSVVLGSGNGGSTGHDVMSSTIGRWERLVAASGRPPVNEVVLYAASAGGAEFLVDSVAVRATG
ncbi:hypothetical protein [Actinoplanes sp. NPDC049599]|uniref:hypothetical protein n=1 Tax=Actinoplanes sp. NPDC049599 TaxID=3363903 RepID=UPI00378A0288